MNAYLLQSRLWEFPQASSASFITGLAIFIGVIVLLSLAGMMASRNNGGGKRFRRFAFRSRCRAYGLTRQQMLVLEHVAISSRLAQPDHLFENQALLDGVMRKAVKSIETSPSLSDAEKEGRKAVLFQIRQQIDREAELRNILTSSRQLKFDQDLEIVVPGGTRASTRVNRPHGNFLSVDIPLSLKGYQVKPVKGTDVKVTFSRNGRDLYSFDSKVLGYSQNRSMFSLILQHSDRLQHEQKRRFRRKEISIPAYFYPILIMENGVGKKKEKQAMVDTKRRYLGTLLDISAGGCSLRTTTGLPKGQLLKIEFNAGHERYVTVLGKVLQISRESSRGTVMHIMFTRVSQRNINIIQEYVFGFTAD